MGLLDDLNDLTVGQDDFHNHGAREKILRAPFPYPGGKGDSTKHILPHLPYRKVYVEPFGGSGAVLLARNESPLEVFNDRFSGVTCFYRVLRDPILFDEFRNRCELVLHSREEFVWSRDTWKNCSSDLERAARWWYMVNCSFSGKGLAFGRATGVKAQFGPKLKNNVKHFYDIHKRLTKVQIENQDAFLMIKDFDSPGTVFYFDPPYLNALDVYNHNFTKENHIRLLNLIFELEGFVALSGYDNDLYDTYPWDDIYEWEVQSTMATLRPGKNSGRSKAKELLWIKQ